MKVFLTVATLAGVLVGSAAAQNPQATKPAAGQNLKQRAGYSYGYNLGRSLKSQGVDLDAQAIAKGIADAFSGAESAMNDQEMRECLEGFAREMQEKQAAKAGKAAVTNKVEGEKFLAANKAQKGITTLPSGLQYKVIKQGNGPKPKASDKVTVHYEGKLLDGTIFDSSIKRGEPISFDVTGVIPGWTEALQIMPVGSTWQLFIPSNLAYGEHPRPGPIGPNALLIFEVQLLKIGE